MNWKSGGKYTGFWKGNNCNGQGTYVYANNDCCSSSPLQNQASLAASPCHETNQNSNTTLDARTNFFVRLLSWQSVEQAEVGAIFSQERQGRWRRLIFLVHAHQMLAQFVSRDLCKRQDRGSPE